MLSGNCTEALSIQANVTISGSSKKLIKNDIAPLPFPLPALLKQYWYIKRGERGRMRGHAPFYATLGYSQSGNGRILEPLPDRGCVRRTSRSKCGCPKSANDPKTRGLPMPLRP